LGETVVSTVMARLEGITTDDLRQILAEVEGKVPAQRVTIGIHYKEGVSQTTLAERYGVHRNTIGNWLARLERLADEPFEEVVYDAHRSGRPSKLTDEQRYQLEEALSQPPTEAGIDAPAWTPALAQQYIAETFDAEYHIRHVRRLMEEAGLSYKTARPEYHNADERAQEAFKEGFEKSWVS
jgi:transposase